MMGETSIGCRLFVRLEWLLASLLVWGCASASSDRFPDEPVGAEPSSGEGPPVWVEDERHSKETKSDGADEPESGRRGTRPSSRPEAPTSDSSRRERLEGVFPSRTLDLDFRRVSVRRVIRLFREEATHDIVLAPEIKKRVTVRMEDARLTEAFLSLLDAAELSFERRKEVIFVGPANEE